MDITKWSIPKSDWLYSLQPKMENHSIQSAETRPGADCGSDHELLIAKFKLKLKKGKTTRPFSSVQLLSRVRLFATPWIAACQASLFITISRSSLRLMSSEFVMPSSHLILGRPLLLLPLIPLSIRVFSNESTLLMRWPKYWSFSFSIIPYKEIPRLISFRMDWLDLCSSRDSQESSPAPQFKRINSSALSLLHSPTLTSIHDHWKNHSLD